MRRASLILLLLAGCQSVPDAPETVYVTVEKIVPVPAALVARCDEVAKRENTYGEAVRLANARLESLKACNAKLAEIEALTP